VFAFNGLLFDINTNVDFKSIFKYSHIRLQVNDN